MNQSIDYISLMDIAKINLSNILNNKMAEYRKSPNHELKKELMNLVNDRKELFLFNTEVIEKYL